MRQKEHRRRRDRRYGGGDDSQSTEGALPMQGDCDRNDERRHDQQADLRRPHGDTSVGIGDSCSDAGMLSLIANARFPSGQPVIWR
jgi:hypothetical protein